MSHGNIACILLNMEIQLLPWERYSLGSGRFKHGADVVTCQQRV